MKRIVFGCGYLGRRVAQRWRDAGDELVVATRSVERAREFHQQGYEAIVADVTQPPTLNNLPEADTVLFAVGHDRDAGPSIHDVYAGGMLNVLDALPATTGRFVYISTTGVYGNTNGGWVDEQTAPNPGREGGRASLAAEQVLAAHSVGRNAVILRLAGIYGPGRVPFLDKLRSGEPIPAPSSGVLNLIHVDDAATAVLAAARIAPLDDGPRLYCVSDGRPVERCQYYAEVARQIGAQPPQFIAPDPSSPRAARAAVNRRVRNNRMVADLAFTPDYPDYRKGLASLLETQNQQSNP